MLNHPHYYEEQLKQRNRELKEIDKNAWKWHRADPRQASTDRRKQPLLERLLQRG